MSRRACRVLPGKNGHQVRGAVASAGRRCPAIEPTGRSVDLSSYAALLQWSLQWQRFGTFGVQFLPDGDAECYEQP